MFRLLTIILAFIIICASSTQSFAREQSEVKVTSTDKYIRLFFYCKQPVSFTTSLNGNKLKVSFKRDIAIDTTPIKSASGSDINNAIFNSANNTATITLANSFYTVRKFMGEDFIGVDIIRPLNQARKSASEPSSEVSYNSNELPVEANLEPSAGIENNTHQAQKIVNNDSTDTTGHEPDAVNDQTPAAVSPSKQKVNPQITSKFIPKPKLRQEFVKTAAAPEEKPSEIKPAENTKSEAVATQPAPETNAPEVPKVAAEPNLESTKEPVSTAAPAVTDKIDAKSSTEINQPALQAPGIANQAIVASPTTINQPATQANIPSPVNTAPAVKMDESVTAPQIPVQNIEAKPADTTLPATAVAPTNEVVPAIPSSTTEPVEDVARDDITEDEIPAIVPTIAERVKDKLLSKIVFPWKEPVAASVFKRAGYLWIVFDKEQYINVPALIVRNTEYFASGEQMPNRFYTILRLKLKNDINTVTYKEDNTWVIGFLKDKIEPEKTSRIDIKFSDLLGSKVILDSEAPLKPLRLVDQEVGDEIVILPSPESSMGIKEKYKYVDFAFLETSQGAVIQVISDNVDVAVVDTGITVAGPSNRIANVAQSALKELKEKEEDAKQRAEKLKQQTAELTMLKFNTWMLSGPNSFKKDLKEIEWKIAEVNWSEKSIHRLDLARFYLAHGMAAEALGVVRIMKEYDEKTVQNNDVKIIEATALYLMNRYKDALEVYDSMSLNDLNDKHRNEVMFWRIAADLNISNQIKADSFVTKNPLKKEEDEEASGDKVGNTELMRDTSMRLLKMIRKMDPDFVNSDELQKLEATARFVTNHYQEAIKRFEETELYSSGDMFQAEDNKLWWSASDNKHENSIQLPILPNVDGFLKNYPTQIFNDFALLAVEDSLKKNDLTKAEEIIATFKPEERFQQKNSIEFFRGLYYAKNDEDDKAIEAWEKLAQEIMDPYNRTRAKFAMTVLQLDKKKIDVTQAIANLNSVRNVWRGEQLEFHILNLLGEFYMETQQPMEGFRVWREAISAFPGSDESLLIAKKMSEKFVKIFSQGEADKMPQIDAITLYYEFRELTPIGKLGDELISKLVDRLINVDLLDRASALLTHQVRFRLVGEELDIASTKLIKIHLINHDAQKAIDVLDATENANMSQDISLERRYLRSQALLELGKSNKVLVLLNEDYSKQAAFLRADVYWRNNVWRKVVDELEVPFRDIRRENKQLNLEETNQVIRLAVAYALIDRQKRLQVLYEDFADLITDQGKKDLLTFIATNKGPVDYNNLEQTVEYKDMQNFLNNYMKPASPLQQDTAAPAAPAPSAQAEPATPAG